MRTTGLACLALAASTEAFSPSGISSLGQHPSALRRATEVARRTSEGLSGGLLMVARKPFIAGNWKMNPVTVEEAKALASAVAKEAASSPADVRLFERQTAI